MVGGFPTKKGCIMWLKKYFEDLFKTMDNSSVEQIMLVIPRCVTQEMNNTLTKPVKDKEIVEAFNQMDTSKAPRCNGLSGLLFKENWDIVGRDVVKYYKKMLAGEQSIKDVNDTIVVFIPKGDDFKDMIKYRPISLCWVIYKWWSRCGPTASKCFFRATYLLIKVYSCPIG